MTPGVSRAGTFWRVLAVGGAAGVGAGMVLSLLGSHVLAKYVEREVRKDWSLAPVVVANGDFPAGTVLTLDMIAQRVVPEQLVTASVVLPEKSGYLIGRSLLVPVEAGQPLRWFDFHIGPQEELQTCLARVERSRGEAGAKEVEAMQERLRRTAGVSTP